MTYTWTTDMGNVAAKPAIELQSRAAVIAACTFLDSLPAGSPAPTYAGSYFRTPRNVTATNLIAVVTAAIATVTPALTSGIDRETVIATAVNCSMAFSAGGGGAAGWTAMTTSIVASQAVRGKIANAVATPPAR